MLKRLLRYPAAVDLAGRMGARYVRLVWFCCRWRVDGGEILDDVVAAGRPVVFCCWHGRLLIGPKLVFRRYPGPMRAFASAHRDGVVLSRMMHHLGIGATAGSSRRRGAQGLLEAVRLLRRGETFLFTPDGPCGPRMRAAPGAVTAAKLGGAPLVPVAGSLRPSVVLGTWDRFMLPLPLPFGRGILRVGEPIEVPGDAGRAEIARLRRRREDEMIRRCRAVDTALGLPAIEPEPPAA